ncbi:MAG: hypothetical protein ACTHJ0_03380 [Flavipsychrobacter sp.]
MKYILLLLLLSLWGYGQQNAEVPAFSRTVAIQGTHGKRVFSTAIVYCKKNTNRFYVANNEAAEHAPLLKRKTLGETKREALLGYESSDRDEQQVMADALIVYETTGDNKCMQLLAISCDVRIDCKSGGAEVRLQNLRYHHLTRNKPATLVPINNGDKAIESVGNYSDLQRSNICPEELAAIDKFVKTSANKILDNIAAGIGGNLKEVDW